MLTCLPLLFLLAQAPETPPLPEGNAYVRALVARQRHREEALNRYTYDMEEIEESLDAQGLADLLGPHIDTCLYRCLMAA